MDIDFIDLATITSPDTPSSSYDSPPSGGTVPAPALVSDCSPSPTVSGDCSQAETRSTRRRAQSWSSDSDFVDEEGIEGLARHRDPRSYGGPRPGTSWAKQKALKLKSTSAGFQPEAKQLEEFRGKVLSDDLYAEFKSSDYRAVRCSACAKWINMRALYDVRRWKDHRKTTVCQQQQQGGKITKSLLTFFSVTTTPSSVRVSARIQLPSSLSNPSSDDSRSATTPCPGLTRESSSYIDAYLSRSSAPGGGAPARRTLAFQLFPDLNPTNFCWSDLSLRQQKMVLRREEVEYKWHNQRQVGAVFSVKCTGEAGHLPAPSDAPSPCDSCACLWKIHTFRVALNRRMPVEENMKFVPKAHRCPELGAIYLKYEGVRQLVEQVR